MRFFPQKSPNSAFSSAPWRFVLATACLSVLVIGFSRSCNAQTIPQANALPTLFVVGDSTARNNAGGAQGWGDPLKNYFDLSKINVVNRAMAGRSSRTFTTEGRWENVVKEMKAGDTVLLQIGHNDGGAIEGGRGRASLPGLGEESREISKADGTQETVRTYGHYMRRFIADTKAKGATPVVLSLTIRNIWKDGQVERGSYRDITRELAQSQNVEWLDLSSIIADKYQQMGQEATKAMFGPDYVHTSPAGADLNAASVIAGLKSLNSTDLAAFLSEKGRAVSAQNAATALTPVAALEPLAPGIVPAAAPNKTLRSSPVPADPTLPTLFLIGDSTVRNGQGDGRNGQWGWGDPLAAYFDKSKINIVNRAVGGLSSRTYLTGGFWNDTLAMIKPGDFVMMQFGHNDASALNDDSRARGTIRSAGEESEEIDNWLTKKRETVRTYGWYLRRFIADARSKGATSFVLSPIPRKGFTGGKASRSTTTWSKWAQQSAQMAGAMFLPLNEISAAKYDVLGPEKVAPLFADANTHTNLAGAEINAQSVIEALKSLEKNPLAPYFSTTVESVMPR